MGPLNIAIAVGGKFSSEEAALALHRAGHTVEVLTTLPRRRFHGDLQTHSFVPSELVYRVGKRLGFESESDLLKMRLFGRFAKSKKKRGADIVFGWSSFSKEFFDAQRGAYKILVRESTHIRHQMRLLEEEYEALGVPLARRGSIIERELEEYEICDRILVCSQIAKETFIEEGIAEEKVAVIPLGVDTTLFRPRRNHTQGKPLKLLYVGALSVRKGVLYLLEATKNISPDLVELTCAGPVEPGMGKYLSKYSHFEYLPAMPSHQVSPLMRSQDAFFFPTLEDGYGSVLIQAIASGLVPISTTAAGSSEWISHQENGILVAPKETSLWEREILELARNRKYYHSLRANALLLRGDIGVETYHRAIQEFVNSIPVFR